jgi:large subunit ribosomal protein L25
MAGERVKLQVQERVSRGSAESRRLRGRGLVPGVLYGNGGKARPFCIEERELRRALTGDHGLHAILDVVLEGQQKAHHAVLKEYQLDPKRARLLHIDLQEVRLDQAIHAQVVVELVGESEGAKEGGVLSQVNREVNVEALPMEVPERLELDVSAMLIGDSMRVSDLRVLEGVKLLDDEEMVLATVTPPTKIEEPEPTEEELAELEEGEEPAEGEVSAEEMPEGAAEAPAEPEADAAGEQGTTEG